MLATAVLNCAAVMPCPVMGMVVPVKVAVSGVPPPPVLSLSQEMSMNAHKSAEIKKFLLICRTENGERRTENGERRTENGERRTENGERVFLSLAFFSLLYKQVKPSATLIGVIVAYRGRACQGGAKAQFFSQRHGGLLSCGQLGAHGGIKSLNSPCLRTLRASVRCFWQGLKPVDNRGKLRYCRAWIFTAFPGLFCAVMSVCGWLL